MVATKKDLERKQRIELLDELRKKFEYKLSRDELTPSEMIKYKEILQELIKLRRIERARWDLIYFAEEYFGEGKCSNPEHVLLMKDTPVSQFHRDLSAMIMEVKDSEGADRMAIAAPRGHAKSTFGTQINLMHTIVYELANFAVVISAVRKIAVDLISWVTSVLKTNDKIREDFGNILDPVTARNELDREDSFICKTGMRVDAYSMLSPIRGLKHMGYRPDCLILDDIESEQNVSSKEQMKKALQYFNSTVLPIVDPTRAKIYYVGTVLAKGSLLDTVLKQGSWKTRVWSAIEQEADNQQLWQVFRDKYLDFNNPNRYEDAMKFYEANKEEMDKGSKVLWPTRLPYVKLQLLKYDLGVRAFASEYMNKPSSGEDVVFDLERILYYDHHDDEYIYDGDNKIPLAECDIMAAVDIARGKEAGDWTAFTIGAKTKSGVIYILESNALKIGQLETVEKAIEYIKKYRPSKFVIEAIGYQGELAVLLKTELQRQGILGTTVVELGRRGRKEAVIQSMEPYLHNGTVRLHKSQYMLLTELNDFRPDGSPGNDDSIDSLSMLLGEMLNKSNTGLLDYYKAIMNRENEVKGMISE
jgi:predicted phage terminase large subunit-like protein